jgi:hypothetical protein
MTNLKNHVVPVNPVSVGRRESRFWKECDCIIQLDGTVVIKQNTTE